MRKKECQNNRHDDQFGKNGKYMDIRSRNLKCLEQGFCFSVVR